MIHDNAVDMYDKLQDAMPEAFEIDEDEQVLPPQRRGHRKVMDDQFEDPELAGRPVRVEQIEPPHDLPPPEEEIEDAMHEPSPEDLATWESAKQQGVEAFAWYQPRHFYRRRWGIYIKESGLQVVLQEVNRWMRANRWKRPRNKRGSTSGFALCFSAYFLLRHENFHFLTELFAAKVEAITGRPRYIDYSMIACEKALLTGVYPEEHLATFDGAGNSKIKVAKVLDAFKTVVTMLPPCYRAAEANLWPSIAPPVNEWEDLSRTVANTSSVGPMAFAYPLPGRWGVEHYRCIPTYLWCDRGGRYMKYLQKHNPVAPRYEGIMP